MTAPAINTPKKVWVGIALMAAAVVVAVAGYFRSQAMSGDFQPIAVFVVACGWGVVLSVAGIVCAMVGARSKPRSLPTKAGLALAALFSIATLYVAVELVRIFAT